MEYLNRGIFFGFGLTTGVLASCMAYYFWGKKKDKRKADEAFLELEKKMKYELKKELRKEINNSQCIGCEYWSKNCVDRFCYWHTHQLNKMYLERWKQELARVREARSKRLARTEIKQD